MTSNYSDYWVKEDSVAIFIIYKNLIQLFTYVELKRCLIIIFHIDIKYVDFHGFHGVIQYEYIEATRMTYFSDMVNICKFSTVNGSPIDLWKAHQ
jgi:hypothetical protein